MDKKDAIVSELCKKLKVPRATLYRYIGPNGELRKHGKTILNSNDEPQLITD